MNADAFRHLYEYHFAENRVVWNHAIALTEEQFAHTIGYSHDSIRDQLVHIMSCDNMWFSELRGIYTADNFRAADFADRNAIRTQWDKVEQDMRGYLADLRDDMLPTKPLLGEDKDLIVWQVLVHVVNHATDHRAQVLRMLHDLGVKTVSQDYIFYVYDHLM